jgi:hypothetical protein
MSHCLSKDCVIKVQTTMVASPRNQLFSVYRSNVGVQSGYRRGRSFQLIDEIAVPGFEGLHLILNGGTSITLPISRSVFAKSRVTQSRRASCLDACRFSSR